MKRKWIGRSLAIVFLLVAIGAWYAYREFYRTPTDTALLTPKFQLSAAQVLEEYASNAAEAADKYTNRLLSVTGTIREIDRNDVFHPVVVLGSPDGTSAVRCSMDSLHSKDVQNLQPDQHVTINGFCSGYNEDALLGSDLILIRCVLKNNSSK